MCAYVHSEIVSAWMRLIELTTKVLGAAFRCCFVCVLVRFISSPELISFRCVSTSFHFFLRFLSCTHPLMWRVVNNLFLSSFFRLIVVAVIIGGACVCVCPCNFPHKLFVWIEIWSTILESAANSRASIINRSRRLLLFVFVKLVDDDTERLPTVSYSFTGYIEIELCWLSTLAFPVSTLLHFQFARCITFFLCHSCAYGFFFIFFFRSF